MASVGRSKGKTEEFHLAEIARADYALESTAKSAKASTLGDVVGVIPLGIKVVGPRVSYNWCRTSLASTKRAPHLGRDLLQGRQTEFVSNPSNTAGERSVSGAGGHQQMESSSRRDDA